MGSVVCDVCIHFLKTLTAWLVPNATRTHAHAHAHARRYALGRWAAFKALLRRDVTLMSRNSFLYM
jgi:hypothetical protein